MRYAALIYTDPEHDAAVRDEELPRYAEFGQRGREAGNVVGGEELAPAPNATTVRLREGEVLTTDGPFAETKEQLGGFYLLDCGDLDEAIELAAQIPGAQHGVIEVRPLIEH
jgi:hypothetical protein